MPDPLTVATGVGGFLSLALQVGKILYDYSSSVKNAPEEVQDLLDEVNALAEVLEQLRDLLQEPDMITRLPDFSPRSVLYKVLGKAGDELKGLYRTLSNSSLAKEKDKNKLERAFARLQWPLGKTGPQDSTRRLYQLSQALSFSLTVSNCKIMSQACDEIIDTINAKNAQIDSLLDNLPQLPDELSKLSDQMKSVLDLIPLLDGINSNVNNIALGVKSLELDLDSKMRDRYFSWMSSLDPPRRHLDVQASRTERTGQWFLDDHAVRQWDTGRGSSVLLCFGIPGAGKTILTTRPRSPKTGVAYVYCDYRDQSNQTLTNILGALLKQLLQPLHKFPDYFFHVCGDAFRASEVFDLSMAERLLELTCMELDKVYICLDALDECSEKTIAALLASLKKLYTALSRDRVVDEGSMRPSTGQNTETTSSDDYSQSSLKLIITSRPHLEPGLVSKFEGSSVLAIEAKESDIRTFVKSKIEDDSDPYLMNDGLRNDIVEKIARSSQKMFLLPALQIHAVLEGRTLFERRENLRNFPSNLDGAFKNILSRIQMQSEGSSKTALKIIAWAHLTTRPLLISEMFHALATNKGDVSVNWDNFQSPTTWLKCCLGLVIVDKETSTVRLVHNSFDQYLSQQGSDMISFQDVHLQIAETCLTYLNLEDVSLYASREFSRGNRRDKARLKGQDDANSNSGAPEANAEEISLEHSPETLSNAKLRGYYAF
ncbi:hypothetical protein FQN54_009650 [Arachnomyces sp. PD_36]|nr:hypothetical protein FQN54_009650 [Arachnomyces sp. PD_36]